LPHLDAFVEREPIDIREGFPWFLPSPDLHFETSQSVRIASENRSESGRIVRQFERFLSAAQRSAHEILDAPDPRVRRFWVRFDDV
jgi:hypothetical protein